MFRNGNRSPSSTDASCVIVSLRGWLPAKVQLAGCHGIHAMCFHLDVQVSGAKLWPVKVTCLFLMNLPASGSLSQWYSNYVSRQGDNRKWDLSTVWFKKCIYMWCSHIEVTARGEYAQCSSIREAEGRETSRPGLASRGSIFTCNGCCKKVPPTRWHEQQKGSSLIALGAGNLSSKCQQGLEQMLPPSFWGFLAIFGVPWLIDASPQSCPIFTWPSPSVLSLCPFGKDTSHIGLGVPLL